MKALKSLIFCLIVILGVSSVAKAAPLSLDPNPTLYVKPLGQGNCTSWGAACDLQTALSNATTGDQIWVAAGTYKPTTSSDPLATFQLKSDVAIYGGFPDAGGALAERKWLTHITTLSGDIGTVGYIDDNSYQVVTGGGVDGTAIMDGFTISGGNANGAVPRNRGGGMYNDLGRPTLTNITFTGNSALLYGGGMANFGSSPTLTNVTFSGNTSNYGGGMSNSNSSSPSLTNVTFSANSAGYGCGMYNYDSSSTLTNVTFSANPATYDGGGMYNYHSNSTLNNVTFSSNSARYGGGIYNTNNSNPALTNVTLTNVTFSSNSATYDGGGMYNYDSSPTLSNVTFYGNTAPSGGGMSNSDSSPMLTNVTFSGNLAYSGGGMYNINSSNPTLTNAIVWENTPTLDQIYKDETSSATITYSDIEGWTSGGTGNINLDPELDSLANNGGFTKTHALGYGSRAIDAGTAACTATDQRGYARPIDGDNNGTAICDMGAYEYGFTLTVETEGSGSVIKNPDKPGYGYGEEVTLTPTASSGWTFASWSGNTTVTDNKLTITGDTSIIANFTQNNYTLTVAVDPLQAGTVTRSPDQTTFHYGEEVTLTPNANPGWTFTGWSGGVTSTTNPLIVTITDDTSITANFTQNNYTLTVAVDPLQAGTVTRSPDQTTFHYGDEVTLTPSANPGWTFSGWGGDASGTINPLAVTMSRHKSITANFTQDEYTLAVAVDPEGKGSVSISPEQTTYHYGNVVTLTATASNDWAFSSWSGDATGTDNPLTVTIYDDTSITANWEQIFFRIYLPIVLR